MLGWGLLPPTMHHCPRTADPHALRPCPCLPCCAPPPPPKQWCVKSTALDARRLGWRDVSVVRDATRPMDQGAVGEAEAELQAAGVRVVSSAEAVALARGMLHQGAAGTPAGRAADRNDGGRPPTHQCSASSRGQEL